MKQILFWTQKEQYGAFSNFTPTPITIDGRVWPTVEHFYQAMKSPYLIDQENIRMAKTPGMAKRLGQKCIMRDEWELVKMAVMTEAVFTKFSTYPELKKLLLETGDAEIYEDSPFDKIWGTGVKGGIGEGQNLLGKVLMHVRDKLRAAT